jgi:hypothetical protein
MMNLNDGTIDSNTADFPNFDTMTPADFERYLPDFFAASSNGKVSSDPKLQKFLSENPDCAALVKDLETIAETVRDLFAADASEPSDDVWLNLQRKLSTKPAAS